ncbi:MAG: hypothetical protein KJN75_02640, partial [Muriicola sp.]|nr:hypothetical protein [Muriicola sp.]
MKYRFLLAVVFMGLCTVNAQSGKVTEKGWKPIHLESQQFKFDLLSPGFSYEIGLFRNQSVSTGLGFGFANYEPGYSLGLVMNNRYR